MFTLFNIFDSSPFLHSSSNLRNMKVKIDTKEKMHVIKVEEEKLSANMTEDIQKMFLSYLNDGIKNVIINFEPVNEIDEKAAATFLSVQQAFYDKGHSMVFCNFKPRVEKFLDAKELLEIMNVTPTVSEACDIVQMEEMERELYG